MSAVEPRRPRPAETLIVAARRRLDEALASPSLERAQLEMARALAVQAVAADASDAEAHLALAFVDRALRDIGRALASFDRARVLDAGLFEAHAGAAALRLRLRDFVAAASAYEDAIRVRPKDYGARLGLALARRGAIDGGDAAAWGARVEAARQAVDAAIALSPERPEAYLSAGILAIEYEMRRASPEGERALFQAKTLFEKFLSLAGASPALAAERRIAEDRLSGIRSMTHCDFDTPERVRKEREDEARRKRNEDDLKIE